LAQKIVDGDADDRENYPGLRAAGVHVEATVPTILIQNIEASVVISGGYDDSTVKSNVVSAIKEYVNGLGISGDVLRAELISRIMEIEGVANVTLDTPASDVIILDYQMARTTDSNITVN